MDSETSIIPIIRKFNRFYTKILGLLDKHLLDSNFSLTEVRVLYEIANTECCTAKMLIDLLSLDAGYLSRILKRFEKLGLTYRVQSQKDGRSSLLFLTSYGEETLSKMNTLSDDQIDNLIVKLPNQKKKSIARSMIAIERALSDNPEERRIHIRSNLKPGDIGMLIHMHGWIYSMECGYNHLFEGYVCKTFYEFLRTYSQDKDRFWIAEEDGEIVGSIAIIGHSNEKAQLRWFILHPDYRGIGIGKMLFQEAMGYCKEMGYQHIFLETTEDQKTAIAMYKKEGFKKISEQENESWGMRLLEQTYELYLK